ncbi:MAG: hypothetical protein K8R54_19020 [Bacteroidales bacterium]|nr:hypothetical protein [Bacteroidales bacterium]
MQTTVKIFFSLLIVFIACNTNKTEIKYYKNGKIKEKFDKKKGLLNKYYENGKYKLISGYKDSLPVNKYEKEDFKWYIPNSQ